MNETEAKNIFDNVIRGHWENWPSGNEELLVWVKALKPFDFKLTRDAINELYEGWKGERYPKMPAILGAIHCYARQKQQTSPITKRFQIETEDGRPVWRPFWAKASIARQELEPEAERLCKEADRMFPNDKHIAQWFGDESNIDHGYYGPDAKERAFADILAGPDSKTKRWLEKYLAAKEKAVQIKTPRAAAIAAKKAQEPIAIGQTVDDSIPF